jgi:hypothetical protein
MLILLSGYIFAVSKNVMPRSKAIVSRFNKMAGKMDLCLDIA